MWSVFARSLGEQGADGRTALAWRWALTGGCPSPVTLSRPEGRSPSRHKLVAEADAEAELAQARADLGGQVMHARFVLKWLVGDLDALPLWNGGPGNLHVTDGAAFARRNAEIEEVHSWAMLAEWRQSVVRWRFGVSRFSCRPRYRPRYGAAAGLGVRGNDGRAVDGCTRSDSGGRRCMTCRWRFGERWRACCRRGRLATGSSLAALRRSWRPLRGWRDGVGAAG